MFGSSSAPVLCRYRKSNREATPNKVLSLVARILSHWAADRLDGCYQALVFGATRTAIHSRK